MSAIPTVLRRTTGIRVSRQPSPARPQHLMSPEMPGIAQSEPSCDVPSYGTSIQARSVAGYDREMKRGEWVPEERGKRRTQRRRAQVVRELFVRYPSLPAVLQSERECVSEVDPKLAMRRWVGLPPRQRPLAHGPPAACHDAPYHSRKDHPPRRPGAHLSRATSLPSAALCPH